MQPWIAMSTRSEALRPPAHVHTDYTRFVIIGRGRSGSNLLRGLLNGHSGARVYGELFRFAHEIGWEFPEDARERHGAELIELSRRDPVAFLEREVFCPQPRERCAVGFKLFYYHAHEDGRRLVWPYLQDRRDVRLIHVQRENTLRQLLSEKKAMLTNRWTNVSGEPEQPLPLSLDAAECEQMFRRVQEERAMVGRLFAHHPMIEVQYERLAVDHAGEMARVQDFLDLPREALRPRTWRQANQPLAEAISNYAALKRRFARTPWAHYFDE